MLSIIPTFDAALPRCMDAKVRDEWTYTMDLIVKSSLIFCTGNQTTGMWRRMNKKNETKSRVVVPEDAGIEFGRLF
jgi:hypothetical protein